MPSITAARLERVGDTGAAGVAALAVGVAGFLATHAVDTRQIPAVSVALAGLTLRGARIRAVARAVTEPVDVFGDGLAADAFGGERGIAGRLADAWPRAAVIALHLLELRAEIAGAAGDRLASIVVARSGVATPSL